MILNDAITRIYSKMTPIKSDSPTITIDWVVIPEINNIQKQICLWQITNILDPRITYKSPKLDFLIKDIFIERVKNTILREDIKIGDVEIKTDISPFPDSWYILIRENIIKYTWRDLVNWKLTWVTWIKISHKGWASIKLLEIYPDDCGYPFELQNINNPDSPITAVDDRWEKQVNQFYTVKSDWNGNKFIYLNTWEWQYKLSYYKKPTVLTDPQDNLIIPDEVVISVLVPLVAWTVLYSNYPTDPYLWPKGTWLLKTAYSSLQTFYGQEAIEEKTFRKKVKRQKWRR